MNSFDRWLVARDRQRADLAIAALLGFLPPVEAALWWRAHPWACLMGEDAVLWALASGGIAEGTLGPTLHMQRGLVFPLLVAVTSLITRQEVPTAAMIVPLVAVIAWPAGLYLFASRRFGRGAGLAAGVGAGFHTAVLMRVPFTGADLVFLPLFLLAVIAIVDARTARGAALAGLAVAVATLCKPQALLLLPLLLALSWRRGAVLAAVVPVAVLVAPWLAVEATFGTSPVLMAGADAVTKVGLAGTMAENVVRFGMVLLAWSPLLAGLPFAFRTDADELPDRNVLALAGASMFLALPVLWQPRHVVGFAAVLGVVACAAVPALLRSGRRAPAFGLLALALGTGVFGAVRAPAAWDDANLAQCSPTARQAGRWIREEGRARPDRDWLGQDDPALSFYGRLPQTVGAGGERAFIGGRVPPLEGERIWLVVAPDLADRGALVRAVGPRPPAEGTVAYESGAMRILVRDISELPQPERRAPGPPRGRSHGRPPHAP